jgi:hypothetical protein
VEVAYCSRIVAVEEGEMGFPKPDGLARLRIPDVVSPLDKVTLLVRRYTLGLSRKIYRESTYIEDRRGRARVRLL